MFGIDDAIMVGATAAGIGLQLFGSSQQDEANQRASRVASQTAQKQNNVINEDIIPLMKQQAALQKKAAEESMAAEKLRAQQMELDALRQRRDIVKNAQLARSLSLFRSATQGSGGIPSDSSYFGGLGQIFGQEGSQLNDLFQNLQIGRGIFQHNLAMAGFLSQANQLQTEENIARLKLQTIANTGSARVGTIQAQGAASAAPYTALGSSLVSSAPALSRLGTTALFGSTKPSYTQPLV